jgi:peptidyl-prolyl cis-trans isomerase SurA
MYRLILIFTLALAVPAAPILAQREPVDKIAVVVGDKIILASELATQVQLLAIQNGIKPKNEQEVEKLQHQVLERMISDELFLMEAEKDTSITIRREEVDQALDEQIARISSEYGSEDQFLQALSLEGLTLRDLKKRYRDEIRKQLLKQRYIQQKLYSVSISRHEVDEYYREFKDSIPDQPEGIKLAHILLQVTPSQEVEDSVKQLAVDLRQRIVDGADFATISAQYSSFGAGAEGGDLGYVAPDDVVPEFSRAAFRLQPGDISGVVRTQFGYHIIKCEAKRGDRLRLRHVLLGVPPSAEDSARAYQLADSLLKEARGGADFGELAKAFSTDDDSRANGGELGWFAPKDMPAEFRDAVSGWTTPGEIRGPVKSQFGLHILKLLDYQPEKTLTLENDFDQIKEIARQDKTARQVDKWIEDIKEKTYIDYRIDI